VAITVTETDQHCVFSVTSPSYEEGTIRVFNEDDDDVTRDIDGTSGPVHMRDNGDGTFSGMVSLIGLKAGEVVQFTVTPESNPDNPIMEQFTLSHDCPEFPRTEVVESVVIVEEIVEPEAAPVPPPAAKPKAARKPKPKAKTKAKAKAKAKKPAAKAKKKAKPKAKPKAKKKSVAKAKKAKPAKKKPAKKKKRR
jgi:hypothetical protein